MDATEIDLTEIEEAVPKQIHNSEANTEALDTVDLSQDIDDNVQVPPTADTVNEVESKTSSKQKRKSIGLENKGKKTNTALEKEAKKQKLAAESAAKRAANEINKAYKPGECMKYMCVEVHPALGQAWYMADVGRELSAAGARLQASPLVADEALVLCTRARPHTLATEGQLRLTPSRQQCGRALCVYTAAALAELGVKKLADHLAALRVLADCRLTLIVFGAKDYFKSSGRKTSNSNKNPMTELDLEMAFTDLLVTADCDAVVANTPNELALLIVQFTKAIAEEPHKKAIRAIDEQADFYMRGDNKNCVAVDQHGNGVDRLWQQMIAILPHSSLETSRSLCAKYKSPMELYEALQTSNGVNELADVGVARAAVPGSKARKIGPEFARKLKTLFTSEDGNVLLE